MLYLIQLDHAMKWINLPSSTIRHAERSGLDLAGLAWSNLTTKHPIEDVLRVALRYGHECSRGIVIDGGYVMDVSRPSDLRAAVAENRRDREGVAGTDRLLDSMGPGWAERMRKLDEQVDDVMNKHIERADVKRAMLLEVSAVDRLVEHWERGSGSLPEPL